MHFDTVEESQAATDRAFGLVAAPAFMTPTSTPRFLVTNDVAGNVVIAFGGAGYYPTNQTDPAEGFEAVASVHSCVVILREQVPALIAGLTTALAPPVEGAGDGQ